MARAVVHIAGIAIVALAAVLAAAGCGGPPEMMPTPNLYARGNFDPFADVPTALRDNGADVLYITDRAREDKAGADDDHVHYGFGRSRSIAFGIAHVEFGKEVSWNQLVEASRTQKRSIKLPMTVTKTTELGRLPPTPRVLVEEQPAGDAWSGGGATLPSTLGAERRKTIASGEELLSSYLARSPVKDVYLFVHGYNNNFDDSVTTIAQLWHFLGRQGLPIAYSWPAGHGGLLRGYTYDRESSEFTVYHLKEMIRRIAQNPDVRKVNLIAHSRGTDVTLNALRELHLEVTGSGRSTREVMKLGVVILAAPDVDFDVLVQRCVTARLGRVPERAVTYVCSDDRALGISNWLFSGGTRLGKVQSTVFTSQELATLRDKTSVEMINAQISKAGNFGHDYFHSNPAVSSDLILALRYHLAAGAEFGRPLAIENGGFWVIDDKYPTPATTRPATTQPKPTEDLPESTP